MSEVKDFIFAIAVEMNKKPETFQKFVDKLEEEMFDDVESLKDITDDQWSTMKFPMALVNKIKKALSGEAKQPVQAP